MVAFLSTYRVKKNLVIALTAKDIPHEKRQRAFAILRECSALTIPYLFTRLEHAPQPEKIHELLHDLLDKDTLPFFVQYLAHENVHTAESAYAILATNLFYERKELVQFFSVPDVPKRRLGELLNKSRSVLIQYDLGTLVHHCDHEAQEVLCHLIESGDHSALLPAILRLIRHGSTETRMRMTALLRGTNVPVVRDTLMTLLEDPSPRVRQQALASLARITLPCDLAPLCALLHHEDALVRRQAARTLIARRDPATVSRLLRSLTDTSIQVRQAAAKVLYALADATSLRDLLAQLPGLSPSSARHLFVALRVLNDARGVEAAMMLLTTRHPLLYRGALGILHALYEKGNLALFTRRLATLLGDTRTRVFGVLHSLLPPLAQRLDHPDAPLAQELLAWLQQASAPAETGRIS